MKADADYVETREISMQQRLSRVPTLRTLVRELVRDDCGELIIRLQSVDKAGEHAHQAAGNTEGVAALVSHDHALPAHTDGGAKQQTG
jgi:hypothetical protein